MINSNNDFLSPVLVRTTGRSGSTLMMHLLSCSDDIWFHKKYPFEARDLSYLFRVANVCTCASEKQTKVNDVLRPKLNLIGRYPYQTSSSYLSNGKESLSLMIKDLWRGYSREVHNVAPYRFYAEKVVEDAAVFLNGILPCKNLFLIRDPRAEMLSILRFNEKRKTLGFGWEPGETAEEFALKLCGRRRNRMRDLASIENNDQCIVIYYEDLIQNFESKVSIIESFLDTKICRDKLQAGLSSFSNHMTSSDAIKSIDEWKHELTDNIKQIFSLQLKDELAALGYEP